MSDIPQHVSGDYELRKLIKEHPDSLDKIESISVCELTEEYFKLTHITSLTMDSVNLIEFPLDILRFEHLVSLNLSRNEITEIPPEIGQLVNIKYLNLSYNRLKILPKEIVDLQALTELFLVGNELLQLPDELEEIKTLELLQFGTVEYFGIVKVTKVYSIDFHPIEGIIETFNKNFFW